MNFLHAISGRKKISVIAEVKRRSPSFGAFPKRDLTELVRAYERGGAAAISVVTDAERFGGSLELLRQVRALTALPILRKDFLSEEKDLDESKAAGANAVLLIARFLTPGTAIALAEECLARGMSPVLEIHDLADLPTEPLPQGTILGVNNRNLADFTHNVEHGARMLPTLDASQPLIAESGFARPVDLLPYIGKIDAVLIGTALLTAADPKQTLVSFSTYAPC